MQKGASLYIAFMIMTLCLGIVLGLTSLFMDQIKNLRQISFSALALEAADAGIEQALAADQALCQNAGNRADCIKSNIPSGNVFLPNGASYGISIESGGEGSCSGQVVYCAESFGKYKSVLRAVKIAR